MRGIYARLGESWEDGLVQCNFATYDSWVKTTYHPSCNNVTWPYEVNGGYGESDQWSQLHQAIGDSQLRLEASTLLACCRRRMPTMDLSLSGCGAEWKSSNFRCCHPGSLGWLRYPIEVYNIDVSQSWGSHRFPKSWFTNIGYCHWILAVFPTV